MALVFRYQPRDMGPPVDTVTIDRYLYLTEDQSRVVEEGNPAGRWLWASPGSEVPRADAVRLGALPDEEPDVPTESESSAETEAIEASAEEPQASTEPEAAEEPEEVKEKAPPPNKQRAKPGDKSKVSVDELRRRASGLGVQVDNRWGADRLRREIAAAEEG